MSTTTERDEFLGTILTGMIQESHFTTNRLIDGHLDSAIDWARRFEKLYQRIQWAIESGNVLKARRILDDFAWEYDDVPRAIEHYESMKMSGR